MRCQNKWNVKVETKNPVSEQKNTYETGVSASEWPNEVDAVGVWQTTKTKIQAKSIRQLRIDKSRNSFATHEVNKIE